MKKQQGEEANMHTETASLGGPLQAMALFLFLSVIYDRYVTPMASTTRPTSIETWWWGVYVLAAPLVFGGVTSSPLHPLVLLFATRLVVEMLLMAKGNWFVAVSGRTRCSRPPPIPIGLPVLPD